MNLELLAKGVIGLVAFIILIVLCWVWTLAPFAMTITYGSVLLFGASWWALWYLGDKHNWWY